MFSISWSVVEAPSRTEFTPSFFRHQAVGICSTGRKAECSRSAAMLNELIGFTSENRFTVNSEYVKPEMR